MKVYDTIIIGAGPAGIQLAALLQQHKRDYLLLEGGARVASFFHRYPRHRQLLSINKRYTGKQDSEFNLRHDWNSLLSEDQAVKMTDYSQDYFPSAEDFVHYLEDFVKHHQLAIRFNSRVVNISQCQDSNVFMLKIKKGQALHCQRLVIATGVGKPYIPNDVPGIELAIGYEAMTLDVAHYKNKHVLIIGKGNSALETADHLIAHAAMVHIISPTPIRLAWDSRYVGDVRAVNNNFFDTYRLKSQNASMDGKISKMWRNPDNNNIVMRFRPIHAPEIEQMEYNIVLRCTGFRFDTDMFDKQCQPALTPCGRLPAMRENFESTTIPNLFYAGTLTQMLDYKKSQSAFVHGFRYNARTLFYFLEERFEKQPWPKTEVSAEPEAMAMTLATHLNRVSSLWQQVGFLADVWGYENEKIVWYRDLPYEYIRKNSKQFGGKFFIIMFRIQPCHDGTLVHERSADIYQGESNITIHPIIEYYQNAKMLDKFHVLEDLLADWSGEDCIKAIMEFFKAMLAGKPFHRLTKETRRKEVREIIRDGNMRLKNSVV